MRAILVLTVAISALVWTAATQAQSTERCTTSEFTCTQAGLPYTPVPALGALTRVLTGEPELLRVVRSIATVPCADLVTNQEQGKTCEGADGSFAIVEVMPETGAITVARLLTGEPAGVLVQMQRAVCTIYAVQVWGDPSERQIARCMNGER
jgi:hypothetical protein